MPAVLSSTMAALDSDLVVIVTLIAVHFLLSRLARSAIIRDYFRCLAAVSSGRFC